MAAEGFSKLRRSDVRWLGMMFSSFRSDVCADYCTMALHCFAALYTRGKPPYFTVGKQELAQLCQGGSSVAAKVQRARRFLAKCERDGFFVRLEDAKPGKIPRRTFWFLLPESDILGGLGLSGGGLGSGANPTHPNTYAHIDPTHPKHISPDRPNPLTESTETQSKTSASLLVGTSDSDVESLIREHYEKTWRLDYLVAPPGEAEVADGDGS